MPTQAKKQLYTRITRFILTGGLSAIVDYSVTMLSHYALGIDNHLLEKALGFIAGTTTAYLINKRWTFEAQAAKNKLIPIIFLYLATLLIQMGLYDYLVDAWGQGIWSRTLSFIIAQGVATVINFVVQHSFIFKLEDSKAN